jgi:hypothetical protein
MGYAQFFCTVVDFITIPLGVLALAVPTRTISALKHYCESAAKSDGDAINYNFELRAAFFYNFFYSIGDLIIMPLGLVTLFSIVRTPAMIKAISEIEGNTNYDSEFRGKIILNFANLFLDVFVVPFAVVYIFTFYRLDSNVLNEAFASSNIRKRLKVIKYSLIVVLDALFVGLELIFAVLFPWRLAQFCREFGKTDLHGNNSKRRRTLVMTHGAQGAIDVVNFLAFTIIFGLLYR